MSKKNYFDFEFKLCCPARAAASFVLFRHGRRLFSPVPTGPPPDLSCPARAAACFVLSHTGVYLFCPIPPGPRHVLSCPARAAACFFLSRHGPPPVLSCSSKAAACFVLSRQGPPAVFVLSPQGRRLTCPVPTVPSPVLSCLTRASACIVLSRQGRRMFCPVPLWPPPVLSCPARGRLLSCPVPRGSAPCPCLAVFPLPVWSDRQQHSPILLSQSGKRQSRRVTCHMCSSHFVRGRLVYVDLLWDCRVSRVNRSSEKFLLGLWFVVTFCLGSGQKWIILINLKFTQNNSIPTIAGMHVWTPEGAGALVKRRAASNSMQRGQVQQERQ